MPKYVNATKVNTDGFGFYVMASKADQQLFIDKFGKTSFDDFQKFKQRIKSKGYSADLTYHIKNTSLDDMEKILWSVSDDVREQEVDIEGKQIPEDNGNYEIIAKSSEWTVYQPLDYIASIHCAHGARWCTAGGYDVPEGKVKVSQAKQYFNNYIGKDIKLYYCINSKSARNSIAVAVYPDNKTIEYFDYNDDEIAVTSISKSLYGILQNCEVLPPKFVIDSGILVKYNGAEKDVVIPDSVTSIGDYAFLDCSSLTSVTIPNSITSIGQDAFLNCSSLMSITIPDSITSIGQGAFWNCSSLTSIIIPSSVTRIGQYAFYHCTSLKSITIPDSVKGIGSDAFKDCTFLTVHTNSRYVMNYCKNNGIEYDNDI